MRTLVGEQRLHRWNDRYGKRHHVQANWWTQGTDPADHNGAFRAPWTAIAGAVSTRSHPLCLPGNVYTAGMTTIEDGIIYRRRRGDAG
mgnify:CR=1 FL=1